MSVRRGTSCPRVIDDDAGELVVLLRAPAESLIIVVTAVAAYMSRTMSVAGRAQQMSTWPSAGSSSGAGE